MDEGISPSLAGSLLGVRETLSHPTPPFVTLPQEEARESWEETAPAQSMGMRCKSGINGRAG